MNKGSSMWANIGWGEEHLYESFRSRKRFGNWCEKNSYSQYTFLARFPLRDLSEADRESCPQRELYLGCPLYQALGMHLYMAQCLWYSNRGGFLRANHVPSKCCVIPTRFFSAPGGVTKLSISKVTNGISERVAVSAHSHWVMTKGLKPQFLFMTTVLHCPSRHVLLSGTQNTDVWKTL